MPAQSTDEDTLRIYLNKDEPLGPVDASQIIDDSANRVLFDASNILYKQMSRHPPIVIGRRGSGKTAFLNSAAQNPNYDIVVSIKTQDIFRDVVQAINRIAKRQEIFFVENASEIWMQVVYIAIASEIAKKADTTEIIRAYYNRIVAASGKEDNIFIRILRILAQKPSSDNINILAELALEVFSTTDPARIRREINIYCETTKRRAIVLIDTLEDYHIDNDTMRLSLQGLLRCLGQFKAGSSHIELRLCLPVELFTELSAISTNRLKDFNNKTLLHWHGGELSSLVSRRFKHFLQLHYKRSEFGNLTDFDPTDRHQALRFLNSVMPSSIINGFGSAESPLSYILRHTQLLPRQYIRIMNEIIVRCTSDKRQPWLISETDVIEGVKSVEADLWREVCTGFRYRHPSADKLCEQLIPNLPILFTEGQLHEQFVRTKGRHGLSDFYEAKRALAEIGCLGVFTEETSIYNKATFEYTLPSNLPMPSDSRYAIHPMFRNGISFIQKSAGKAVYPHGSDPEAPDYRS